MLAAVFRAAGCVVVETGEEREVTRTLVAKRHAWVLAISSSALGPAFRDAHPTVPIIEIGAGHQNAISGRITVESWPQLASQVHALVRGTGEA